MRGYTGATELIPEGRTELPFENGFTDAATYWQDDMEGQRNRAIAGQGQNLAKSVDLTGRRKMLDLGGGAASYSLPLCAAMGVPWSRAPTSTAPGFSVRVLRVIRQIRQAWKKRSPCCKHTDANSTPHGGEHWRNVRQL